MVKLDQNQLHQQAVEKSMRYRHMRFSSFATLGLLFY